MVGNTISQDLRDELIDILLTQGHCVQLAVPMRSHCDCDLLSRQALSENPDDPGVSELLLPHREYVDMFGQPVGVCA